MKTLLNKLLFSDTGTYVGLLIGVENIGDTFKALGIPSAVILIQQPAVENPDLATDADWIQMTSGGTAWQLDTDNLSLVVDGNLGPIRLLRTDLTVNVEFVRKGR